MAAAAVTTNAPKATFGTQSASIPDEFEPLIETFEIPNARLVHGNAFPLGIRLKEGVPSKDVDSLVQHVESLAERGAFNKLITDRTY